VKSTQIRVPKPIVTGLFVSVGALIVASIAIELIVRYTPFTPTAKILDFLALNRNSPAVYLTHYWRELAPQAEILDAFGATPIAMLLAGLVLGIYARRSKLRPIRAAALGAAVGAVMLMLIIAFTWTAFTIAGDMMSGHGVEPFAFSLSPMSLLVTFAELALSSFAYGLGTWLIARNKQNVPRAKPV
jgi:hypothetical protein